MFDVDWNDPSIEKVGERRARKEKEQTARDGEDSQRSKRASTSTRRSSSSADKSFLTKSTADKPSSWFGGVSLKNRLSSKSQISHPSDLRIPIPEARTATPSLPTTSTFCSNFSSLSFLDDIPAGSRTNLDSRSVSDSVNAGDQSESSHIPQTRESAMSMAGRTSAPYPESPSQSPQGDAPVDTMAQPRAKAVQALGADRWIMKTVETVIETHTETHSDSTRPEPRVSVGRAAADLQSPATPIPLDSNLSGHGFPSSTDAPPPSERAGIYTSSRPPAPTRSKRVANAPIIPPPASGRTKFRAHDPSQWKAPDEWGVVARPGGKGFNPEEQSGGDQRARGQGFNMEEQFGAVGRPGNDSLVDLACVQREIKKMALLVPASIIFRLGEKLANPSNTPAYKETEMERKRLMLYALGAFGRPREAPTPSKPRKLLALFETEATATYLAAIHPASSITHVSPSPLSAALFPNVRPIASPLASRSALSLAPNYFSAVYCLPLPSVLSSQDIPGLLRNINTRLVPGGILHLVLINPAPASSSVGPRMRHWMEDNLLLNLERQFRCTNPRKLVPGWLADAGLKAKGSTKVTVKCQAVFWKSDSKGRKGVKGPAAEEEDEEEGDMLNVLYGGQGAARREQQAKLELQSIVGRMLWQETWGNYVTGGRWWWDDPECAWECVQMGTFWEYSIVEAVKEK